MSLRRTTSNPTVVGLLFALALLMAACGSEAGDPSGEASPDAAGTNGEAASPTADDTAGEDAAGESAASCGDSEEWDQLLAAAQDEGEVNVFGPPNPHLREVLPAAFQEAFDIQVNYEGGRTGEFAARMAAERDADVHNQDVILGGANSLYNTIWENGWLGDLRSKLVGEELFEDDNWAIGTMPWMDPDESTILRLSDFVIPTVFINTDLVSESEIEVWEDLLDPKFKGLIVAEDPRESGSGANVPAEFYRQDHLGEDAIRELYLGQEVTVLADSAQAVEDLARGRYHVALAVNPHVIEIARADGLPLDSLIPQDTDKNRSAAYGLMGVAEPAAHPHAAALMANWLACPEGNKIWNEANFTPSSRADVTIESARYEAVNSEESYFDHFAWEHVYGPDALFSQVRDLMIDVLGER